MKKIYFVPILFLLGLLSGYTAFGQIVANNDSFKVVYGATSTIAGDFLMNDTLNGSSIALNQVNVTVVVSTNPGITISGSNIMVAANTLSGSYLLVYKVSEIANPANYSTATITINTQIIANDDNIYVDLCYNNFLIYNVLQNNNNLPDTFNGNQATISNVVISVVDNPYQWAVNLDTNTGSLILNPNSFGHFVITYKISDINNLNNWDIGYATIDVYPPTVYAHDDYFGPIDNITGGITGSVVNNDNNCDGTPMYSNYYNLTVQNPSNGLTLNNSGTIIVAPGTYPGIHLLGYQICNMNGGCGYATAHVTVLGISSIVANYDDFSTPNYPGSITPSVLSNDILNNTSINPSDVTITPLNNPSGFTINSNGTIAISSFVSEGIYPIAYQICNNYVSGQCSVNYAYVVVLKNRVLGKIQYDANNNGCDVSDVLINHIVVKNTNGSSVYCSYEINNSYYLIGDSGSNIVTLPNLPSYFTATPASYNFNFTSPGTTQNVDFCITKNADVNDLEVVLIPIRSVVPGLPVLYNILLKNNGSTTLSGQASIQFDNTKMSFLTSVPSPNTQTVNTLTFNYSNLAPFETRTINNVKFQVLTPPAVDLGTATTFTGSITPVVNDATPTNNTSTTTQIAVNSQDPNDIVVNEGATITLNQAQQDYLHYTIRFQNIGTSNAVNIKVLNQLDPNLDWNTMQVLSSSHTCRLKQKNNTAEFLFENINLPGTTDEPNSHGYITYKIKPKAAISVGDVIPNTADIYFDYNAPIATNIATTTVVTDLANPVFVFNDFKVYPNPTKNNLSISNEFAIDEVEISSVLGQKMITKKVNDLQTTIDVSALSNGIYFVKVSSQGTEKTVKIVKE